jgi:hypothetical protein
MQFQESSQAQSYKRYKEQRHRRNPHHHYTPKQLKSAEKEKTLWITAQLATQVAQVP